MAKRLLIDLQVGVAEEHEADFVEFERRRV